MSTPSSSVEASEGLAWVDAEQIILKLQGELENKQIILVGGQALNLWQTYFSEWDATLRSTEPMASKDIDFCGDQDAVRS